MSENKFSTPVRVLSDLISIPSVNPAFKARSESDFGEKKVSEYLESLAKKAGLSVERQEVQPGRDNLIVRYSPSRISPSKRILLAPHMDTVSLDKEIQTKPFINENRLHGRGACDTKGSIAAMLMALIEMSKMSDRPKSTEIIFAALVDEENKQLGSRAAVDHIGKVDLAIIGEPTSCRGITAHKGNFWHKISVSGRSAHGAKPDLGDNAISKMAKFINLVQEEYLPRLKTKQHELLGSPTLNIGMISGGYQNNIVPNECSIEVDRRTLPGESEESFMEELNNIAHSLSIKLQWFDSKNVDCPPMESDPNEPHIKEFLGLTKDSRPQGVSYFCDAAIIQKSGSPCIVFGPGDISQAHTDDEWIDIDSLNEAYEIIMRYFSKLP